MGDKLPNLPPEEQSRPQHPAGIDYSAPLPLIAESSRNHSEEVRSKLTTAEILEQQKLKDKILPMIRTRGQMKMLFNPDPVPVKRPAIALYSKPRKRRATSSIEPEQATESPDKTGNSTKQFTKSHDTSLGPFLDSSRSLPSCKTPSPDNNLPLPETGMPFDSRYDKSALIFKNGAYYIPKACERSSTSS